MKKYIKILQECSLFHGIEESDLSGLIGCLGARTEQYNKKETIVSEGDPAKYIGILLSGKAQIIQNDYFGNRTIVADIYPSELFAESFACAGVKTFPVDVIASENTEVMFIDCDRITRSCTNSCEFHRQIIYNLMRVVARKNLMFHQKIEITSKRTTREKLLAFLMIQAKKHQSRSFEIAYDRQELADYLQVERSGLSAEISKLRKEGIIDNRKNHFVLL